MSNDITSELSEKTENNIPRWSKSDTVFSLIILVCSVFFIDFSVFGGFNAGFTASFLTLFVITAAYLYKSKKRLNFFGVFCGTASICFAFIFVFFNNTLLNFLFFLATFFFYGVFLGTCFLENEENAFPLTVSANSLIVNPLNNISKPFNSYGEYRKEKEKRGINKQVVVGILLSLPVLLVVIPLLVSSDAAFEGLILSVFSGIGMLIAKIILGIILSVYLFSMLFAHKKGLSTSNYDLYEKTETKKLPKLTAVTFSSVLIFVYLIYLLSQSAYFFSGFSGILPKGYSFSVSDYARRGFFELCAVCAINFLTVSLILRFTKPNESGKTPVSVRITSTVICAFSLLLSATAISKMFLYIGFYALTRLRLLTSIFMVAIAVMFIILIASMYVTKRFSPVKCAVVIFAVLGILMGFFDVDRTVASYNVNAYKKGYIKEMDVYYLGGLSDSAVPYIASLIDCDDETVKDAALTVLYERADEFFEINGKKIIIENNDSFKNYNYSRKKAKDIIIKNIKPIMKAKKERETFPEQYYTP